MAKRDRRHPSLRGHQVARWLKHGILKADQLGDTPILVVRESVRVRLTPHHRTTLSQGIFLVPRWIPAPAGDLEKLEHLSKEDRGEHGLIHHRGMDLILIYQQVESLNHLTRQQSHILWDREHTVFFESVIRPHIVGRARAAAALERVRRADAERVREINLENVRNTLEHPGRLKNVGGLLRYLDGFVDGLDVLAERPYLVVARKKAQRSVRRAQKWIRLHEFGKAAGMIRRAQEHLRQIS
ncbi:MAG TPA: hypothetical protein VI794_01950 [Patescibacteria group bacterium]|nr:hypothetical protein [Patescibacteria group bacterium]